MSRDFKAKDPLKPDPVLAFPTALGSSEGLVVADIPAAKVPAAAMLAASEMS